MKIIYLILFLGVSILEANNFYYYDSFNNKVYPKIKYTNYLSFDVKDSKKVSKILEKLNIKIIDKREYKGVKILKLSKSLNDNSIFKKNAVVLYRFFGSNDSWPVIIYNRGVLHLNNGYDINKLSKEFNFKIISHIKTIDLYIIETKFDILPLLNKLKEQKISKVSQPNFLIPHEKRFIPNDTYFSKQWHLNSDGSLSGASINADINAPEAWDIEMGSPNIKISIVDDGMDVNHPDLFGKIVANHDFLGDDDFVGNENDDSAIHGTSCAGVASAIGNNNEGVIGSCPNCSLISAKIMGGANNNYSPATVDSQAIIWSAGGTVENVETIASSDVISCSWGFTQSMPIPYSLKESIDWAVTNGRDGKGAVVLFASGNDGREYNEGELEAYKNIITVGASNDRDTRSYYSNYGVKLDLLAPSNGGYNSIWTTDYQGSPGYNMGIQGPDDLGNYTKSFGGTSSATPLVSGVVGLILSKKPSLTWIQVRDILRASSEKINSNNVYYKDGWDKKYGYGRLNSFKALKLTDEESYNDISSDCQNDTDCNFMCIKDEYGWKDGSCSLECSYNYCLEGSVCVDKIPAQRTPLCLTICESVNDCKNGYRCNKFNESDSLNYCIPGCSSKGCSDKFEICDLETEECVDDVNNPCWDKETSAPKLCSQRYKSCNESSGICECEQGFIEVETGECAKDMCLNNNNECTLNSECESITGLCICNEGYRESDGKCILKVSKIKDDSSCAYSSISYNDKFIFFILFIFLIFLRKKLSSLDF